MTGTIRLDADLIPAESLGGLAANMSQGKRVIGLGAQAARRGLVNGESDRMIGDRRGITGLVRLAMPVTERTVPAERSDLATKTDDRVVTAIPGEAGNVRAVMAIPGKAANVRGATAIPGKAANVRAVSAIPENIASVRAAKGRLSARVKINRAVSLGLEARKSGAMALGAGDRTSIRGVVANVEAHDPNTGLGKAASGMDGMTKTVGSGLRVRATTIDADLAPEGKGQGHKVRGAISGRGNPGRLRLLRFVGKASSRSSISGARVYRASTGSSHWPEQSRELFTGATRSSDPAYRRYLARRR